MTKAMPTLATLFKAVQPIITFGLSINAASRQKVINVCGELCDSLTRSINLAESYLQGARYYKDDQALITYLQNPGQTLMHTYLEHNICAAIYSLSDRLKQIFDPTRYSLSLPCPSEIITLIHVLQQGERVIIDDFQDMIDAMSDLSNELSKAKAPSDVQAIKQDIERAIDFHLKSLKAHRRAIKDLYRKIVDGL